MKQLLGLVRPNELPRAAFHRAFPSDMEVLPTIGLDRLSCALANVDVAGGAPAPDAAYDAVFVDAYDYCSRLTV